ncbi:hypothetical protein KIW84_057057 [Lathyrus oleraceus]|uniref:FH2 domain-containing protein n=1 Tax=Pisum sativum TaxID=3888 RepID=A0A9D4X295_PEA|nr:hypothetical protein KIW84_057056 [Pisum sativum]KAI5412250.1 hypothetical protein KIW84_057057 [Pisum sativum]
MQQQLHNHRASDVARQVESEMGCEDSPSTDDSRVNRPIMSIYAQNFAIPMQTPNFALMTTAMSGPGSDGSHGEKKRACNCEIMLSKVKVSLQDLMSSMLALEESLDVDQVENLIKFCPAKEEMEIIKGYKERKRATSNPLAANAPVNHKKLLL